jgi:hypothetical protein
MPAEDHWPDVRTRRHERERQRVRRAALARGSAGASAMARALAQIEAAFDEAAAINDFKIRVERFIRLGPQHPAVRARFAARAAMLRGRDLDAATALVERWWRDERKAFQIASAFGCATRLSLEVLRELRLILRLMRCQEMATQYKAIVAALGEPPAVATEPRSSMSVQD